MFYGEITILHRDEEVSCLHVAGCIQYLYLLGLCNNGKSDILISAIKFLYKL